MIPCFVSAGEHKRPGLIAFDFRLFSKIFKELVSKIIPTTKEVLLFHDANGFKNECDLNISSLKRLFGDKQTGLPGVPVNHKNSLYFPFFIENGKLLVLQAKGIDSYVIEKIDFDWSEERMEQLLLQFTDLKLSVTDICTGLPDRRALEMFFDTSLNKEYNDLLFIEVYPKGNNSTKAIRHLQHSSSLLRSFLVQDCPLFYLGNFVFACFSKTKKHNSVSKLGKSLLALLKKEDFPRVRVAWTGIKADSTVMTRPIAGHELLHEAWQALQVAHQRGPFSLCSYDSLQNADFHPLAPVERSIISRFQRYWKKSQVFTLAILKPDDSSEKLHSARCINQERMLFLQGTGGMGYLFLPDISAASAKELLLKSLSALNKENKIRHGLSIGLCSFPLINFSRSETLLNCKKALLHGALLGKEQITVFDALSLNVSGDIYYAEWDLPKAVREYKRGLLLGPNDENILNSLGVSYALLDKHRLANNCFRNVLKNNKKNLMAMYNLGLGQEFLKDDYGALSSFEEALALLSLEKNDEIYGELCVELGKLYCRVGKFRQTVELLSPWYQQNKERPAAGRILRYIAISYYRLDKFREAAIWLQRALNFDPGDAIILCLLAETYVELDQGIEIALSLCQKALELQPDSLEIQCGAAKVFVHCNYLEEAKKLLRKCVRFKVTRDAARLQMGVYSLRNGAAKKASTWFQRVIDSETADTRLRAQADQYLLELVGK